MNRHPGRARRIAAWVAVGLCTLTGCNAASEGSIAAAATGGSSPVTEAVRVATDRSAVRQEVVTLPNGERMRRATTAAGFNHVLIGKVDADGRRSIACVDSAPAAESFLAGGTQGSAQ